MAFVAINKTPGVYIDEIQVPGPIPGVGTSTAAFVGPARRGPINTPVFLTNWSQFVEAFGEQDDLGPFITTVPVYVTHAVRGFFDNGGSTCFFVRVATAARATLSLNDRNATPQPTLRVTAKNEGTGGNNITVEVQDATLATTTAERAEGALTAASTANTVTVSDPDAAKFRPTDVVLLNGAGGNERATIRSISAGVITFENNLTNTYAIADTIRIADMQTGDTRLRVNNSTGIEPGSYIHIVQGASSEDGVVKAVDGVSNFVTLEVGLANTYTMAAADPAVDITTEEFTIIVQPQGAAAENLSNLSMDPRHSRYFASVVESPTVDVSRSDPPSSTPPANNRPAVIAATNLANGASDNISALTTNHFFAGIDALEREDEVNILCVPDRVDQDVQAKMIAHCEKMQDRFAILDPQANATPSAILAQRNLVSSTNGHAAIYYPRIIINNPVAAGRIKVPPSGHIAGVYARTDNTRGVHKAPANEPITGVLDLERKLADDEHGPLNEASINVIRSFPGRGIMVWGARTLAPKDRTQWRYVNVRRLLLFIEESIQEGTQFAVFEPNNSGLWATVKRQVSDFLTRVWQDGALVGDTPSAAFRVRIDSELNPPSIVALGQLIVEVILFPATPAEFVVFRIIQQPGGPSVEEQ